MPESFDDIIKEYIDLVNRQIGVYMDAMAGFEHIKLKIERQVHRVNRPTSTQVDADGNRVIVWSSYEDPSQPDIIHNRIMRAPDYIAANSRGGSNEQQQVQAVLVFLFSYWEHTIRPQLAKAKGVETNDIKSDVMGALAIVRNAILHSKGVIDPKEHGRMRKLTDIFKPGEPMCVSYDDMHRVFYTIKQDLGRMMFEWLGIKDVPVNPDELRGIAIQKFRK